MCKVVVELRCCCGVSVSRLMGDGGGLVRKKINRLEARKGRETSLREPMGDRLCFLPYPSKHLDLGTNNDSAKMPDAVLKENQIKRTWNYNTTDLCMNLAILFLRNHSCLYMLCNATSTRSTPTTNNKALQAAANN